MRNDCYPGAPSEWSKLPVSALAKQNPRYRVEKGKEYPFVEMSSIAENFGGILKYDTRKLEGSGLARFKEQDTLFAKITPCPENGKIAFVEKLPAETGLGSTEFLVLSPLSETDPKFLYHLLCSQPVRGRAVSRMEGSTGRQRVPDDVFDRRLLVPVPKHEEQCAIARFLDALDEAIAHRRNAAEKAKELRHALLQEMMPPWVGFKQLDMDRMPSHVESIPLASDVCDIKNGATPSRIEGRYWRNGTIPWLPTGKVNERRITYANQHVTDVALRECSIQLIPSGSVLVGMIGQGKTRGLSAYLMIDACINQNFGAFTPKRRVVGNWLFHYFDFHYSRLREIGGGTNQGALNCYLLKRLRLPLPSMDSQKEAARVLDTAEELERSHIGVLEQFEKLKRALMHVLFTGNVRIDPKLFKEEAFA